MKLIRETSPYLRKPVSVSRMMIDVLIALIPVVVFAIYRFGMDAVLRLSVSALVMVGTELIYIALTNKPGAKVKKGFIQDFVFGLKKATINNYVTPLISAIIFALIIPSNLSMYAVVVGAFLGIFLGKLVFGGLGGNIFNPAAVGRIIIGVSFAGRFNYQGSDAIAGGTALQAIKGSLESLPSVLQSYSIMDLFTGNIPGSMGEISALAILLGAAYLFYRKAADWRVSVAMISTFALLTLVASFNLNVNSIDFVLFQLFTGGLLFGAIFMITDPVTSPTTAPGRVIYGVLVGLLVVLIRFFGAYPEGVAFALLIANMFVPAIEYYKWSSNRFSWKFMVSMAVVLIAFSLTVYFGVGGIA